MVMAFLSNWDWVFVTSASSPSPCQCTCLNCRFNHRSICRIIKKPAGVSGLFLWVLNLLSDYRYSNDHTPACQGVCHHQMVRMEVVCMIESCKKMFAMKCLQKTIKPRPSQVAFLPSFSQAGPLMRAKQADEIRSSLPYHCLRRGAEPGRTGAPRRRKTG